MADVTVTVLNACLVVPRSQCQKRRLFLPAGDGNWRFVHYIQYLLFYKTDQESYSSLVDILKTSLSSVLVDFYPCAGRLFEAEDGRPEILCNDAGVEFVEATVNAHFQDLEKDHFQMKEFFNKLATTTKSDSDRLKLPLLLVQVTRFLGGEIAIGCGFSHVLADGSSFWHFMTSWAEYARSAERLSVSPVHDRTLLDFRGGNSMHQKDALLDDFWKGDDTTGNSETQEDWKQGSTAEPTVRVFHFSGEMMRRLKALTSFQDGEEEVCYSSYEVLCAHVLRRVIAARGFGNNTKVGLVVLADVRERLEPRLPQGYFGNALVARLAFATAGQLTTESRAMTARRLREKICGINDVSIKAEFAFVEKMGLEHWAARLGHGFSKMIVGSSPRFPIFEVDFGWGSPVSVRLASIKDDGMFSLLPSSRGGLGSVDVCLALQACFMQNLVLDPQFLSF